MGGGRGMPIMTRNRHAPLGIAAAQIEDRPHSAEGNFLI
jgi:hypothetical protein